MRLSTVELRASTAAVAEEVTDVRDNVVRGD
jgi:hypothetical protein